VRTALTFVTARLSEASSWRGILFICTSIGLVINPEAQNAIVAAGMALAGLVGLIIPDPDLPGERGGE
jgi:hypothetical protein